MEEDLHLCLETPQTPGPRRKPLPQHVIHTFRLAKGYWVRFGGDGFR